MIGFESIFDVFPDKGKAVMIPIRTTAALLVSYRTDGAHWWEYLDVIERALEEAAPVGGSVSAALLWSQLSRAAKAKATEQTAAGS